MLRGEAPGVALMINFFMVKITKATTNEQVNSWNLARDTLGFLQYGGGSRPEQAKEELVPRGSCESQCFYLNKAGEREHHADLWGELYWQILIL